MPRHCHNIHYNSTGAKGGIWGGNTNTSGNYGNPDSGLGGLAYSAFAGNNDTVSLEIPRPM